MGTRKGRRVAAVSVDVVGLGGVVVWVGDELVLTSPGGRISSSNRVKIEMCHVKNARSSSLRAQTPRKALQDSAAGNRPEGEAGNSTSATRTHLTNRFCEKARRTMNCARVLSVVFAVVVSRTLVAQPLQRPFCDEDRELCSDDEIQIGFGPEWRESVFEYSTFAEGTVIPAALVLAVESRSIAGFSTAIAHDSRVLELTDSGLQAVDPALDQAVSTGFFALHTVNDGFRTKGFLLAMVLHWTEPVYLPPGRRPLVEMIYELRADAGTEGSRIAFDESIGDPPVQTVLTVVRTILPDEVFGPEGNCVDGVDNDFDGLIDRDDGDCELRLGESWRPRFVTDGLVRRARRGAAAARPARFVRGDCDGDGEATTLRDALVLLSYAFLASLEPSCLDACDTNADDPAALNVSDAVYALDHALLGGPPPPPPYPECGTAQLSESRPLGCRLDTLGCAELP